jgi:sugar/nucleoside kinase (ribokinase family)
MSLLVTGSIGIDTVVTPHGVSEDCLGGSSVYFSMAASFFGPVRLVGVIGVDCPFDLAEVFAGRDVDLTGLEVREQSKTFRWKGTYSENMDERTTDLLELNVLAEPPPKVPVEYKDSEFVFLANTAPALQLELLGQVEGPSFVAADTMDCWIQGHLADLTELLKRIDCLIINEEEARLLANEFNLIKAGEKILALGPKVLIIKKGESGSLMCGGSGERFILPAYPAEQVKDPTGAGDSFAGALMGYLAKTGNADFGSLKTAVAYGTVVASFAIADFSLAQLTATSKDDIEVRLAALRELTQF